MSKTVGMCVAVWLGPVCAAGCAVPALAAASSRSVDVVSYP
jgi:hypothetical protein